MSVCKKQLIFLYFHCLDQIELRQLEAGQKFGELFKALESNKPHSEKVSSTSGRFSMQLRQDASILISKIIPVKKVSFLFDKFGIRLVYVICQKKLDALLLKFIALERLNRILVEKAFLKMVQQTLHLQIIDAKDRYLKLMEESPEIIKKIPLYHIANYLGIAPKSLSRIRKEILK